MQTLFQDIGYGFRMLAKAPGVSAVAILSLAIGIGANTALFSVVDAVLLRNLPVKEPERLVLFGWQAGKAFRTTGLRGTFASSGFPEGMRGGSPFQARIYEKMRDAQKSDPAGPLSTLFSFADLRGLTLLSDGQAEVVDGQVVSGGYFSGLGAAPALGRLLNEADDAPSAAPAAVIGHGLWVQRFGGDPSVIGKEIRVNQKSVTIVGVTAPGFVGPSQVDYHPVISLPMALAPSIEGERARVDKPGKPSPWWPMVMGRLKPGATLQQAQSALAASFQTLALEMMPAPTRPDQPATLKPSDYPQLVARPGGRGMWEMRSVYSSKIYLLFAVVALVLVIACANVANLLLTRAALRSSEITVRVALGAGRGRLLRQLLTESFLMALIAGGLGVLMSVGGKDALLALGAGEAFLPRDLDYALNWRVLVFTIVVSAFTAILFGLVPAWRATRVDLAPTLKDGTRAGRPGSRSRLTQSLVVAQVSISVVLLVGAGLFLRSLLNLQSLDLGFDQENLLLFSVEPGAGGYKGERLPAFYQQAAARLEGLPGVVAATFAQMPLVAHYSYGYSVLLPGETSESGPEHQTAFLAVRENYLRAMQIGLKQGRDLAKGDVEGAPKVAVVNETFARKYFPKGEALGSRIGFDNKTAGRIEIVGISRDITYNSQAEEREPLVFIPWRQRIEMLDEPLDGVTFSVRSSGDVLSLVSPVRLALREIDPALPLRDVKTQVAQSAQTLGEQRMYARLLTLFASLALVLASMGLFGVMAYSVAQRTGEIGIRMALGARRGHVLRAVLGQGLALVGLGLLIGSLGATALRRVVASQLFGVEASDPKTIAGAFAVLVSASMVACLLPALRATRVDPVTALRRE